MLILQFVDVPFFMLWRSNVICSWHQQTAFLISFIFQFLSRLNSHSSIPFFPESIFLHAFLAISAWSLAFPISAWQFFFNLADLNLIACMFIISILVNFNRHLNTI